MTGQTKVGIYNVEYGHPVAPHVKMILTRFHDEGLEVLSLAESQDYTTALRTEARKFGHRLVTAADPRGNALLVHAGATLGKTGSFSTPGIWFNPQGHEMRTPDSVWAVVNGVRYVAVHAPVDAWVATAHGRTFTGPDRRLAAYENFIEVHERFARRHPGKPLSIQGDWNCSPSTVGKYSPDDLRHRIGGAFVRPRENTGHGEIDFAVVRGLAGAHCQVERDLRIHSDHHLVTAEMRKS